MSERQKKMRVLAAMSGGVDSSVAAALLVQQGHEVVGVSMKLHHAKTDRDGACCTLDDFNDARAVADRLGIAHYVVNLVERFDQCVIADFLSEYAKGRTPNPCIRCNDHLKFRALMHKADELECDALATGHYAIIRQSGDGFDLLRGADPTRDQSYFLFTLTGQQMRRVLFPVGEIAKDAVRGIAREMNLPVAEKSESREICFVPDDDYRGWIEQHHREMIRPGRLVDKNGKVLGKHNGVHRFTIGQRKGLGISHPTPLYVIALRPESGEVVVGDNDDLMRSSLVADAFQFSRGVPEALGQRLLVKIRYNHPGVFGTMTQLDDRRMRIDFERPVRAITPGQAAVVYDGDRVVGGGWIEEEQ